MSTLATNAITDASGGNTASINGYTPTVSNMAGRNRIINGDMRIDQRNAGAEINPAVSGVYYLDRWTPQSGAASKFKIGQNAGSVTPPTGFTNYLGCTSLSSYTVGASEAFNIQQRIEGFNLSDLAWGTASAATVTLSFWVRSSLTGTFGGFVNNSNSTRSYPFSYTISSSNTWEQKSITIAGDTSGTWLTTNGIGMIMGLSIGAGATVSGTAGVWGSTNYRSATGATSVVGTSGATFYITGVQLEAGSVATPFEHRQYGQELALCQRYFVKTPATTTYGVIGYDGYIQAGYFFGQPYTFPVTMRSAPTGTIGGTFSVSNCGQPIVVGTDSFGAFVTSVGTGTGNGYFHSSSSGFASFSAEL